MTALLSNVTIESLRLRLEKDLGHRVYSPAGFDAWRTELLDTASPLWREDVKTVFIVLHGPALVQDRPDPEEALSEIINLLERVRDARRDKLFVVATLDIPAPARPLTAKNPAAAATAFWRCGLEERNFPLLDLAELVAEAGREHFYSARAWVFGALPFSNRGEKLLAEEMVRIEGIVRGGRKKCLVLDLDNTLWGGVIGEDGLEGLSLARSGLGSQYRAFQQTLKTLADQGVLLAVATKNNLEDALLPFREHPDMALREEDLVKIKANWSPKPENIAAIAQELNIGLDALVFVDDNPVERAAVKAAFPEVAVPDFPSDSAALLTFGTRIARSYFTALRLEGEDLQKTELYKAEARRETARASGASNASLDDYLASLEMKLDLHRLRAEEIARAAQLTQKTNQFNLTGRRYTEADIAALTEAADARVWMGSLKDRFGDYGRIALVVVKVAEENGERTAFFDTFLMSCRVMGRGVEKAVLSGIEKELEYEGILTLFGAYVPTAKNVPVSDFWSQMGYRPVEGNSHLWRLRFPFPERRGFVCPSY